MGMNSNTPTQTGDKKMNDRNKKYNVIDRNTGKVINAVWAENAADAKTKSNIETEKHNMYRVQITETNSF